MIRYKKLGYVELNVSDLATSEKFYRDIVGLEYVGKGDGDSALFRCDSDHHSVVLHQKKPAGFRCVGWMLGDESQFANLHRRLRTAMTSNPLVGSSNKMFLGRWINARASAVLTR